MFPRWQPSVVKQLDQLQKEMNQLFQRWGGSPESRAGSVYPPVNVWEDSDALYLEAELPGLNLDDLEIFVVGNQLSIKGERKPMVPESGVAHRQERGFGAFARTLTLPVAVDADNVDAHFEHGILRLKLTKHESSKPRKIVVKAS